MSEPKCADFPVPVIEDGKTRWIHVGVSGRLSDKSRELREAMDAEEEGSWIKNLLTQIIAAIDGHIAEHGDRDLSIEDDEEDDDGPETQCD